MVTQQKTALNDYSTDYSIKWLLDNTQH